ncbi:MAG: response regulator [Ginsengibacter sp.]
MKQTRILIVDDNEDILFMMQAMLQLKEYKVFIKDNFEAIESFITDVAPDMIIMDMLLRGADGREICKRLKSTAVFSGIPIVMISAHSHMAAECLDAGASHFLAKPFAMSDLYEVVDRTLA